MLTHRQLRTLAVSFTAAVTLLAMTGCTKPQSAEEAMVQARGGFIASVLLFSAYAHQPFCDKPAAPKPPLCADRSVVIEGDKVAGDVRAAMDAADVVIAAKGVPDMGTIATLLARFQGLVNKARGG